MDHKISSIKAREILSAGAFPTLETTITLENGITARASVPFGTSAGEHEAAVIQDKEDNRYDGRGMLHAVANVAKIEEDLKGMNVLDQRAIDSKLNELDSTPQKTELGGNTILSISLAAARTASVASQEALYLHIRKVYGYEDNIHSLPKPMMVLIEGGAHADESTDFQEYLITVDIETSTKDRIRAGVETYHSLSGVLKETGYSTNVGLEGAYAPSGIESNALPLQYMKQAIENAGYTPGTDINLAMDTAASEFYEDNAYVLSAENRRLSTGELMDYYISLVEKYPLLSIEDPFNENDWQAWQTFNQKLGDRIMVVGDDLTVSQLERTKKAVEMKAIDSMIIKPNQAGTLSEIMDTVKYAKDNNIKLIVSHRGGGETTDTFIADLGAAIEADYIKTGPSRGERVVKYNRLMEIAEQTGL